MGSRLIRFEFTPDECEQLETIIKIPDETQSIIHGIVKNHSNEWVKNAPVNLYRIEDVTDLSNPQPVSHTLTDECGTFMFGPLEIGENYLITIWVSDTKIRKLMVDDRGCREIESYREPYEMSDDVWQEASEIYESIYEKLEKICKVNRQLWL